MKQLKAKIWRVTNMKKKMIRSVALLITSVIILSNSIVVFAAPKTMQDGTKFDAEYYADSNPDVVAALGRDEKKLYQHYVDYGKKEGRKAYKDDKGTITEVVKEDNRTKLGKATKCKTNDKVINGSYLNLPMGAMPSSGTTSSGVQWESSWYLHYSTAWENIYSTYSYPRSKEDFTNGAILSEIVNQNLSTDGVLMYLDFGYFTDYEPQLKEKGLIPQSYQLPNKYYSVQIIGNKLPNGMYEITTDCPEAMTSYNRYWNYMYGTNLPEKTPSNYTPKYIRDQENR